MLLTKLRLRRRGPHAELSRDERRLIELPLKYLRSTEARNVKHVGSLRAEWTLYDQLCALLVQLLLHIQQKHSISRFEEALLLLGYKILSHLRSIKACLLAGWHGTANSLLSLLMSDLNMLMYLGFRRDLIDAWFAEGQDTYQTDPEFKRKFGEKAVADELERRGIKDNYEVFKIFRKTTHGSYWGVQAYTVDMQLVILAQPPDFRLVLATVGFASLFVSALLHWLLMDEPSFGTPCRGQEYDAFRRIHKKLSKATGRFMAVVAKYLHATKGARP